MSNQIIAVGFRVNPKKGKSTSGNGVREEEEDRSEVARQTRA